MRSTFCLSLISLLFGFPHILFSQSSYSQMAVSSLFMEEEILEIKIAANFGKVFKDRSEERAYHAATIWYKDKLGKEIEIKEVDLRVRGNFRRENCAFPPLRLRFPTEDVQGTLFEGQQQLKLVTHCENQGGAFDQYLLQEYLIYKVYNLMTDYSFQVRLARFTYLDSSNHDIPLIKYGFLIEDEDMMAQRFGGEIVEQKVHPKYTEIQEAGMMAVFQYMVGNTDWSIPSLNNVKILQLKDEQTVVAIPYDFDWSGLISIPYAKPNPLLGTSSVKDRVFRGFCQTETEFQLTFDRFRQKKESIYALFEELSPLNPRMRSRNIDYLKRFFNIIETPTTLKREIYDRCRGGKK